VDSDIQTTIEGLHDLRISVFEGSVTGAVAESEERVDLLLVEPAVTYGSI
jgi:hypothetical protein